MKTSQVILYALLALVAYKAWQKYNTAKASQKPKPSQDESQANQEVSRSQTADEPGQPQEAINAFFDVGDGMQSDFERINTPLIDQL